MRLSCWKKFAIAVSFCEIQQTFIDIGKNGAKIWKRHEYVEWYRKSIVELKNVWNSKIALEHPFSFSALHMVSAQSATRSDLCLLLREVLLHLRGQLVNYRGILLCSTLMTSRASSSSLRCSWAPRQGGAARRKAPGPVARSPRVEGAASENVLRIPHDLRDFDESH